MPVLDRNFFLLCKGYIRCHRKHVECETVRDREGCQSFIDFLIFVKIWHILIFEGDYDYLPYRCDESQVLAKSSVQFSNLCVSWRTSVTDDSGRIEIHRYMHKCLLFLNCTLGLGLTHDRQNERVSI